MFNVEGPFSDPVGFSVRANAIEGVEIQKLVSPDPAENEGFGGSIRMSENGNTVIVGCPYDDGSKGAAYVFVKTGTTWSLEAKLVSIDIAANDYFGFAVGISDDGNTVAVSAHEDDDKGSNSGSVYIYTRTGTNWVQQAKMTANDGSANAYLGYALSMSSDGSTVVASAIGANGTAGAAYVYTRTGGTWSQQAKIIADDGAAEDTFGVSVAISGNGSTIAVGSYYDDDKGNNSGSVYVFTRTGSSWVKQAKITASDGEALAWFGISVSLSKEGDVLAVGSSGTNVRKGAVYVYSRSGITWSQQTKLTPNDAVENDQFGRAVSISHDGQTLIAGSHLDGDNGVDSGSVYIYGLKNSVWSMKMKIIASDGAAGDYFGVSLSLSGNGKLIGVGARSDDSAVANSGSAYIFR